MKRHLILSAVLLATSFGALAQTAASASRREVHQQRQIEQGLRNGSITGREAAVLQRQQSHIDLLQARALRDGRLNRHERARLDNAQDEARHDIEAAQRNGAFANPRSRASQRALDEVRRNLLQDERIHAGIRNGSLTNHEVAGLERGQVRVAHAEDVAGRDGYVSAQERARIELAEERQNQRIRQERLDGQRRGG